MPGEQKRGSNLDTSRLAGNGRQLGAVSRTVSILSEVLTEQMKRIDRLEETVAKLSLLLPESVAADNAVTAESDTQGIEQQAGESLPETPHNEKAKAPEAPEAPEDGNDEEESSKPEDDGKAEVENEDE